MGSEFKAAVDLLAMLVLEPRTGMLIALLLAAAVWDCRTGRIPNPLVFGGAVLGLACNALAPQAATTWSAFGWALAGLACGLALMLPFYFLRAMGAGDVKLMAMAGAFLGFPGALWAGLATFLAGGLLALAWLAWKRTWRGALRNTFVLVQGAVVGLGAGLKPEPALDAKTSAGTFPYGLAIAAGTIGYLVLHQLGLVRV